MAETTTPNPGSPEAERQGCTCAMIDNSYGRGAPRGGFWITVGCPLHCPQPGSLAPPAPEREDA